MVIKYQTGSRVYGTALGDSDIDIVEVYVPTMAETILGQFKNTQTIAEVDKSRYPLAEFVHMLAKGNPNLFPYLFTPSQYILEENPVVWWLREDNLQFVSQRAVKAMLGMAQHQLRDMATGVTGKMGADRKALVEKHGFDTKAAYHAVRIASMASELASLNFMEVDRSGFNAFLLVDIRLGRIPIERITTIVNNHVEFAEIAMKDLTPEPDYDSINERLVETIKYYWRDNEI